MATPACISWLLQSLGVTTLSSSGMGWCLWLPEHQAGLHPSAFAVAGLSAYSLLPPLPSLAHSTLSRDAQFRSVQPPGQTWAMPPTVECLSNPLPPSLTEDAKSPVALHGHEREIAGGPPCVTHTAAPWPYVSACHSPPGVLSWHLSLSSFPWVYAGMVRLSKRMVYQCMKQIWEVADMGGTQGHERIVT